MKKITEYSLGKHLDAVHLSRQDLEHIDSIFRKVTDAIEYIYEDYTYESVDELSKYTPDAISRLEIQSNNPYVSVKCGVRSVWVYTSSNDLSARGVYAELREFLESKTIRSVGIKNSIFDNLSTLAIIVGTFALIEQHFQEAATALAAVLISWGVQLFGPSRSRIVIANIKLGFWARNRDNFIAGILSSSLVTIVYAAISLAFSGNNG